MDWSTCSPDIVLLIFKCLDYKSLANCLFVCKTWRDLVYYLAGLKGIWPKLAPLAMYDKGTTYKQRSILPWKDLWFNSLLWYDGNVQLQIDKILEFNQFRNMHIFEDNIFIINESGMKQYKVDTFVQILEQTRVTDYQKTHYVTGKLVDDNDLFLVIDNRGRGVSKDCSKFKLMSNYCFLTESSNFMIIKCAIGPFTKSTNDNDMFMSLKKKSIMFNYKNIGTIYSINVNDDIIYMVNDEWNIVKMMNMKYVLGETVGRINLLPNDNPLTSMFLKFSVIYSVRSEDGSKTIKVSEIGDTGEIAVECSGMSCATAHGDVLLVGYEDGEVRVYLAKTLLVNKEPIFKLNIKDVAKCTLKDVAVKKIEVHEAKNSHYLFIATQHELLKVIVTYNN